MIEIGPDAGGVGLRAAEGFDIAPENARHPLQDAPGIKASVTGADGGAVGHPARNTTERDTVATAFIR